MLRLALFLLVVSAYAQDTDDTDPGDTDPDTDVGDTDTDEEPWVDGSSASELAGDEGGPGCDVASGAGLGLVVVASALAATRSRSPRS